MREFLRKSLNTELTICEEGTCVTGAGCCTASTCMIPVVFCVGTGGVCIWTLFAGSEAVIVTSLAERIGITVVLGGLGLGTGCCIASACGLICSVPLGVGGYLGARYVWDKIRPYVGSCINSLASCIIASCYCCKTRGYEEVDGNPMYSKDVVQMEDQLKSCKDLLNKLGESQGEFEDLFENPKMKEHGITGFMVDGKLIKVGEIGEDPKKIGKVIEAIKKSVKILEDSSSEDVSQSLSSSCEQPVEEIEESSTLGYIYNKVAGFFGCGKTDDSSEDDSEFSIKNEV